MGYLLLGGFFYIIRIDSPVLCDGYWKHRIVRTQAGANASLFMGFEDSDGLGQALDLFRFSEYLKRTALEGYYGY